MAERTAWRESFLGEILRIVEIDLDAVATGDTRPYDEAIAAVEKDRQPGHVAKKPEV